MKRIVIVLTLIVLISSCKKHKDVPPNDIVENSPHTLTAHVSVNVNTNIQGYFSGLPAHYASTTKKYPVIICLPGGGQFGNGNTDMGSILNDAIPRMIYLKTFPPNFSVGGVNYSFIIIAPQFVANPTLADIRALLDYVYTNYRVDSARVYMTGISLGGTMTCETLAGYPTELAASVIMGGALINYNDTPSYDAKVKAIVDNKNPIWTFQNDQDPINPAIGAATFVSTANSLNPSIPVKYTVFSSNLHDCWTRATDPTYKEGGKNIYEWMLTYTR